MPASEPSWWYDADRRPPAALLPLARVWGWAAERRFARAKPYQCALPVICVGNFTAGGTGKTPLSLLIARHLVEMGARPAFLTRGYGGRLAGPRRVDPALDTATDVGDEALLLARIAQVMVSADRARGAQLIEQDSGIAPPSLIVMDDGLQNPGLKKDLSIAVVDGRRGVGNGEVLPAGPLRAPLEFQFRLVDAIVVNRSSGEGASSPAVAALRQKFPGPVLEAWPEPSGDVGWLAGARVVAYAGIANPERFFSLLETLGATVVERVAFADHHAFTPAEARRLLARARALNAQLVTTEKDWVRLTAQGPLGELAAATRTLPIQLTLSVQDQDRLLSLLHGVFMR